MAVDYLSSTLKRVSLTHLPTMALIIGLPVFWIELFFLRLPGGHSSWLAWGSFIILAAGMLLSQWQDINSWVEEELRAWVEQPTGIKIYTVVASLLILVYLAVGLYAALLPVHLMQEHDALNYHITVPRQHLLQHSFAHIPWSVPDLFMLPLDHALSPFWLNTLWPNKLIQFLFFLGVLGCSYQLTHLWSGSRLRAWAAVLAVMACHAVAIQVGTAMLDMVMLYCFLAFMHSLWRGRVLLAGIELGFFIWSKAFIAPQLAVIAIGFILIYLAVGKKYVLTQMPAVSRRQWRSLMIKVIAASGIIAGPFLIKSFYYTGTLLYPFGAGVFAPMTSYDSTHWQSIVDKANACLSMKDAYGHGRSVLDFIKHWWLVAIPEKGVNNAFDYPVGLVYLLILAPFLFYLCKSLCSKTLPILSLSVLIWWMTWWFGSQQSRFLLVPVVLMICLTLAKLPKLSKVLLLLIALSLSVETMSLINAHRADWGTNYMEIIRQEDKSLVDACWGKEGITWNRADIAFASCRVDVTGEDNPFVISHHSRIIR